MTRTFIALFICFSIVPQMAVAETRLPDGGEAQSEGLTAYYTDPTDRYDHGILGDGIEAASLTIEQDGQTIRVSLPEDQVFEDLTPRIVDADGDGKPEILTILSSVDQGAAIALYSPQGRQLTVSPFIGKAHRWLNPVGVADFTGDGHPEIAAVETPHIGGVLVLYRWDGRSGTLEERQRVPGFSTHAIGSRDQGLSIIVDWDGDGVDDILLPSQDRKDLIGVSFAGGTFREVERYSLRREISGNLTLQGNFLIVPIKGRPNRTFTRPYNPAEAALKKSHHLPAPSQADQPSGTPAPQ